MYMYMYIGLGASSCGKGQTVVFLKILVFELKPILPKRKLFKSLKFGTLQDDHQQIIFGTYWSGERGALF